MTERSQSFRLLAKTIVVGLAAVLISSCEVVPPGPTGGPAILTPVDMKEPIATVAEVSGDAFIIRSGTDLPVPANQGDQLYPLDRFGTRAGTMRLQTSNGGEIQVYENTDPRIFKEAACFAISFFTRGEVKISGKEFCVNGEVKQYSVVGYEAKAGLLTVWVLEGHVSLMNAPSVTIAAGHRAVIRRGRIVSISTFSPEQFDRMFPRTRQPIIL